MTIEIIISGMDVSAPFTKMSNKMRHEQITEDWAHYHPQSVNAHYMGKYAKAIKFSVNTDENIYCKLATSAQKYNQESILWVQDARLMKIEFDKTKPNFLCEAFITNTPDDYYQWVSWYALDQQWSLCS